MLEIDTQRGRARIPFGRGVYLATGLTPGLRCSIVNLAECAAEAIDAILKAQDADPVARAALSWIENRQWFWWTRNMPWQLEMLDFANAQPFRPVRVTDRELHFVTAEGPGAIEYVVPIADINLDDLGVGSAARGLDLERLGAGGSLGAELALSG